MDNILKQSYQEYGRYITRWRSLCMVYDGLKPSERRVLLSAYDIARDHLVKSRKINSYTTGTYSPHGDSYGTLVQLVHNGFLNFQGNFGNQYGLVETFEAADRYTEAQLSGFIKNIAFEYIKYVPTTSEDWNEEPKFLPTQIPLCLIGKKYSTGISFGYRSLIPCYSIPDIYSRLLYLLNPTTPEPIIKPLSDCDILSSDEELKQLLTTGKGKIKVKGHVEYNNIKQTAILRSWPYSKSGKGIIERLEKKIPDFKYTDLSSDLYNGTYILLEITKQRNRDEIFKKLKEELDNLIVGDISFDSVMTDQNDKPRTVSIDEMLLTTFNMYLETSQKFLNSEKDKFEKIKSNYLLLEQIRPSLGNYLKEIKVVDGIIDKLIKQFNCDRDQLTELLKSNSIFKLLNLKLDLEKIDTEIISIEDKLNNPKKFVLEKYNSLIK